MNTTTLFSIGQGFFYTALLAAMVGTPMVGCGGMESEPVGVEDTEDDRAFEQSDEYIEGEREG